MSGIAAGRRSQDGYILVAVLGVMLLLTSFMAAGSLLVRSALDTARVGDADVAMSGLAQAGLELTAYQLFVVKAGVSAVEGRRINFGGGTIVAHLVDEGGKADLNSSDPVLLNAVFHGVGMDERTASDLVSFIVEMRGRDRLHSSSDASSDSMNEPTVAASQPAKRPRKMLRGFQSVDQLTSSHKLTPTDLRALRPLLTVFNRDGKINILSASREMLSDIPGMSSANVEMILTRRTEAGTKDVGNLLSTLAPVKAYIKTTFGPAYTVRVEATSANGRERAIHAVMAASKGPSDPYYILDWWE